MVETPPVLPAPAIKVGGRRLSLSTKHKAPPLQQTDPSPPHSEVTSQEPPDYPRPAPPTAHDGNDTENAPPQRNHQHNTNEEPPKKERNEKKMLEREARKAEMTRPTRDNVGGKDYGIGMRIRQPSGKALGV
ncbi:hypothetical protein BJ912DRAFT_958287 [Pholiota molesta]|nr:hypothetical protein BJ912DRAFT_958287 [Pholiota molesta]